MTTQSDVTIQFQGSDGIHETLDVSPTLIAEAGIIERRCRFYTYGGFRHGTLIFNETRIVSLDRSDI
ncbi:hypothetical protein [Ensifer aridi]|uniref:hypothetical protein n=1 Tax=Ensifer aridi TaxID=1708715 RepID=UPI001124DA7F|nr:hypothetical protein [Ensifer aridi]